MNRFCAHVISNDDFRENRMFSESRIDYEDLYAAELFNSRNCRIPFQVYPICSSYTSTFYNLIVSY